MFTSYEVVKNPIEEEIRVETFSKDKKFAMPWKLTASNEELKQRLIDLLRIKYGLFNLHINHGYGKIR
jgi:hypothetical protein